MEMALRSSNLLLPEGFVEMDREEMMYVDGGFSIPIYKAAVVGAVTIAVVAALCWIGGAVAGLGLKLVLGSMGMKAGLIAGIVKGLGVVGIKIGNTMAASFVKYLVSYTIGGAIGELFDKYIDPLDGKTNGKYMLKLW